MSPSENLKDRSSWSKNSNYILYKIMIFLNIRNLGNFLTNWYLSITTQLKFKSKNPLAHMWPILLYYLPHIIFHFCLIDFQLNTNFPFQSSIFSENHLTLLKDWFLKKMLLIEQKPISFPLQNIDSSNSLTATEKNADL